MRTTRQSVRRESGLIMLMTLLLATALALGFTSSASAQQTIDFEVAKYTCESDPDTIPRSGGAAPEGCELTSGVAFTIEVADGDTRSCTTADDGRCTVEVPNEATVTVTEDTATAPAGYSPRENPIETQAVTEFAGADFVNLPDDSGNGDDNGNGEPPTELPDTGTGDSLMAGSGLTGALALIAAMSLIAGRLIRRVAQR